MVSGPDLAYQYILVGPVFKIKKFHAQISSFFGEKSKNQVTQTSTAP
jgi:hypothetical protein